MSDRYRQTDQEKVSVTGKLASNARRIANENHSGLSTGSNRVFRGGSRNDDAVYCRSACRFDRHPSLRGNSLGFRLSRTV